MKTHDHDNAHATQHRAVAQQAEQGEAATQLAQAGADTFDHRVNHSPRLVAQRQRLGAAFGPVAQREPRGFEEELPVQGKAIPYPPHPRARVGATMQMQQVPASGTAAPSVNTTASSPARQCQWRKQQLQSSSPHLVAQRQKIVAAFGSTIQRMPVAQLAIRTIPQVTFNSGHTTLRTGILQWTPTGIQITVTATDFTGTSFRVDFDTGTRVFSLAQAENAVTRAGGVLPQVEDSSDDEEALGSASDNEEGSSSDSDSGSGGDHSSDEDWEPGME